MTAEPALALSRRRAILDEELRRADTAPAVGVRNTASEYPAAKHPVSPDRHRSSTGPSVGLTSMIGVPSSASRSLTVSVDPSIEVTMTR